LDLAGGLTHWRALKRATRPTDHRAGNATIHQALLSGAPPCTHDFCCTDRDGRVLWLREEISFQPAGPEQWLAFGIMTDVTERRQAEEERLALQQRAGPRLNVHRAVAARRRRGGEQGGRARNSGQDDLARRFADAPVLGVIEKPYTLDTLRRILIPLLPG